MISKYLFIQFSLGTIFLFIEKKYEFSCIDMTCTSSNHFSSKKDVKVAIFYIQDHQSQKMHYSFCIIKNTEKNVVTFAVLHPNINQVVTTISKCTTTRLITCLEKWILNNKDKKLKLEFDDRLFRKLNITL